MADALQPLMASVDPWPLNWAPKNWALCQGQLLPIAQNTALFSLLGTNYGGNGVSTFALPDLRGRIPVGVGQGPGLSNYALGEIAGQNNITLLTLQMPRHNHLINVNSVGGRTTVATPDNNYIAPNSDSTIGNFSATANAAMNITSVSVTGGSSPINIQQPYLAISYIICMVGVYPSRN